MKDIEIEGADNIASGRDTSISIINYNTIATESDSEIGIINNIFDYVIETTKNNKREEVPVNDNKLLHLNEKILLNFKSEDEINEVRQYFTQLYTHIHWVEKCFQTLEEFHQDCIHHYIFNLYNNLKSQEKNKVAILKKLTTYFLPPKQSKNPSYFSIAQSIVLFFFDDCTIFEKTETEKLGTLDLFKDL